jgi:nucleoside-diphosphate-sugar epimerase
MRILFTGASSLAGRRVLKRLLHANKDIDVWCVRHLSEVAIADPRVHIIDLDLSRDFDGTLLPDRIEVTIHFAGVTHTEEAEKYWKVNHQGTMRLADCVRARGCRRFVYVSTRCATSGSGAYGESKQAAESELKTFDWDSLLVIRPSEIYGAQGTEGIDKLIAFARRWRLTPWLFGNSKINFAPLHIDDFTAIVADEIIKPNGSRTVDICGPEDLSAGTLAARIAKLYKALPIPMWWPLFALFLKVAAGFSSSLGVSDQIRRLTGAKTATAKTADRTGRTRFLA